MKKFMMSVMLGSALVFAGPALAEEAAAVVDAAAVVVDAAVVTAEAVAVEAPAAAEPAPVVDKGDVAWMMTATVLVLLMVVPGLALFYGGLVRSKNMLSVFMQVLTVFSLLVILWAMYGYSLAFAGGNAFIGTLDKVFLSGVTIDSLADTFSSGFKLPEYIFIAFQATFAGITGALIVGAFAERIKFKAVLLFSVLWFTFATCRLRTWCGRLAVCCLRRVIWISRAAQWCTSMLVWLAWWARTLLASVWVLAKKHSSHTT